MEMIWYFIMFIFGVIIGSFLNVVLYRLHTGKSLNGRSHCLSCGKTLLWYELFPIFSYLIQGGRCRTCLSYIPTRYLIVEFLTGLSYVTIWHLFAGNLVLLSLYLVLVSLFILIVVYDIRHTIIPNELTIGVGIIALILLGYEFQVTHDAYLLISHVIAGFCASFFFWGLWFISKGRWIGLGDAKLALPLGMIVGISGVFSMVVLSFWVGAGISLLILGLGHIIKKGKTHAHFSSISLTMKSEVPFAPFLIAGFLLVQFLHADIFTITYTLFFL